MAVESALAIVIFVGTDALNPAAALVVAKTNEPF